MSRVEDFLTAQDEQQVIAAIKSAEMNTSGEIRVHLEKSTKKPPLERSKEVFCYLKMNETTLRNGVLFYVAVDSKQFAIYGDKGIYEKVSHGFWDEERDLVISHFSQQKNVKGLVLAIEQVGIKLKELYPVTAVNKNELTDEISKG
jgi:uncharacterized membrane protein